MSQTDDTPPSPDFQLLQTITEGINAKTEMKAELCAFYDTCQIAITKQLTPTESIDVTIGTIDKVLFIYGWTNVERVFTHPVEANKHIKLFYDTYDEDDDLLSVASNNTEGASPTFTVMYRASAGNLIFPITTDIDIIVAKIGEMQVKTLTKNKEILASHKALLQRDLSKEPWHRTRKMDEFLVYFDDDIAVYMPQPDEEIEEDDYNEEEDKPIVLDEEEDEDIEFEEEKPKRARKPKAADTAKKTRAPKDPTKPKKSRKKPADSSDPSSMPSMPPIPPPMP